MIRILVVDDAPTIRQFLRHVLTRDDRTIDEAVNGIEALEKALACPYDLYLVDVNMPLLDGYGFLRELRSRDLPAAPAVMLSTEREAHDQTQAWAAGANAYLCKPPRPDSLLPVVSLLLGEDAA
jgi:two-component system chemotaxis response regulator CheY